MDPGDDVRVSVGLLERHDPGAGLVVVHPTPGFGGLGATAHDVLGALGRSVRRLNAEFVAGPLPAWRAVTAWLLADRIEDLVVLRADRLSIDSWVKLLAVCRRTGTGLLLVCHVPAVPPALAAILAGTSHQIVTDLDQALPGWAPAPVCSSTGTSPEPNPADLPSYANERIDLYRRMAPGLIGPHGFALTDAVYQRGRAAAGAWLQAHLTGERAGARVLDIAQVQLFATGLVQDSPTRNHTLARLRGAQAGFRARGFDLKLPPWTLMVTGRLSGPGLDHGDAQLSTSVLERIRAGVANPAVAAGIAVSLLTQMPVQFLHSLLWEALSPGDDALRLAWFPEYASLSCSTHTIRGQTPVTAVFAVPPRVRPLLTALRSFAGDPDPASARLFASTRFTLEWIGAAAAHCRITLPDQRRHAWPDLRRAWQSHITCTHDHFSGSRFDLGFSDDLAFAPDPFQVTTRERTQWAVS